jgi:hypothetical protein
MEPTARAATAIAIFFIVFPTAIKPKFCREAPQSLGKKL